MNFFTFTLPLVTLKCNSVTCTLKLSGAWGPPQFLKKRSENAWATYYLDFMWVPINSGNRSESCSENSEFRIAQVVRRHSENGISHSGISHSENYFLNSESCSENTPERTQSSENGLFAPKAFFPKSGWSPGFWGYFRLNQAYDCIHTHTLKLFQNEYLECKGISE